MTDNLESDQEGLVPSGKRELSTVRPDLFRRGLELVVNLEKGARTISFPKDRSVGMVWVTSRQCTDSIFEAQGDISVSAGNHVCLKIHARHPSDLSSLTTLMPGDLDALSINYNPVGDRGLTCLRGLTGLRRLFLIYCGKITDDGLLHLQGLNALQGVWISGARIGDSGLAHLQVLPALQDLHLTHTQVTSAGLSILQNFPALRSCTLSCTDTINDAGLLHLGRLTKLEQLSLAETKISDAGLEYLKDLKNLKMLNLSDTSVTAVGLSRIKNYLPDCESFKWEEPES